MTITAEQFRAAVAEVLDEVAYSDYPFEAKAYSFTGSDQIEPARAKRHAGYCMEALQVKLGVV